MLVRQASEKPQGRKPRAGDDAAVPRPFAIGTSTYPAAYSMGVGFFLLVFRALVRLGPRFSRGRAGGVGFFPI